MSSTSSRSPSDSKLVRELAKILKDTDLTEIEVERGELRIRVAREIAGATQVVSVPSAAPAPAPVAAPAVSAPVAETPAPASSGDASSHPGAVNSPMVGTAYLRPDPDADAFVKTGDTVKEGDTILLVEAMKTFNPITAPQSGTISEILVQDGQPVEYGEPLFIIT